MVEPVIPDKLHNFNFVLLGGDDGKKPLEKGWQKKIHRINDAQLISHLNAGKNYGVVCGSTSPVIVEGTARHLIVVDFDNEQIQNELITKLPKTFSVRTGGKGFLHLYFASDDNKSFSILNELGKTLLDIQGDGKQVVAPNSINPKTNRPYEVVDDVPIEFISYAGLRALVCPYDKRPKKIEKIQKNYAPKGIDNNLTERIVSSVSMKQALQELNVDISKNPTDCPFHHCSNSCLGFNDAVAHCFDTECEGSWNAYSLIRKGKNLTDKETFEWFAEKAGLLEELKKSRKEYRQKQEKEEFKPSAIFGRKAQAEDFYEKQPYFYDRAGIWWLWDNKKLFWKLTDEIDILNMINSAIGTEVIKSVERNEILNALKQFGRLKVPKPVIPTWIQFKDKIFDIKTGETIEPSREYFIVNPIPYRLHSEKIMFTPVMDRVFEEWVGKEYIKTLYQVIAYCLLPSYPLNRLFCFVGSGMNGKSKFLELLCKFIGEDNCTSTELDTLLTSRFEVTRLHKKLVCQMGETNFNEISKTSILKKLTGGDLIGFEYKNKNPFHDKNYAKIIISTNNLPTTTDKTIGFYRRWLILDFPNQFSEQKNILEDIPEEEYESLALKSCFILKDLLDERKFHNEGSVEDRMERYEAKSNFLQKFINEFTKEDINGFITKSEFNKRFWGWCKENRHRQMSETTIGLEMKKKGIESSTKHFDWMNDGKGGLARTWVGIIWKENIQV